MKGWEELRGMFRPESSDFKDSGMGGRRETLRRRAAGEEGTQRWKGRMDAVTWVKTHHDFYTLFHFYDIFPPSKKKKKKKKVKTHSPKFNCYLIPTRPLVSQYYWSQCPNISEKFRHFPLPGVWCCAYSFSCVQLFVVLWTVACQAPLSMGILQARILE